MSAIEKIVIDGEANFLEFLIKPIFDMLKTDLRNVNLKTMKPKCSSIIIDYKFL